MVKSSATTVGILYIVATPIGNRDDISLRALTVLKSVDAILAEDTRHSLQLLNSLGIQKPLISLHAHNEASKTAKIIESLQQGQSLALISDAGTPLISDPGFPLVRQAREQDIEVVPIPGPCALITALCAAGIPCDSFTFAGFLPVKQAARRSQLEQLRQSEHTLVFYESTHRIEECLKDIAEIYGEGYEMVLVKELTKTFERFVQGPVCDLQNWLKADAGHPKGEFVLILPPKVEESTQQQEREMLSVLLEELPLKQAVKIAARLSAGNKNELYKLALQLQEQKASSK